jgi:hypothetical protein
LKASHAQVRDIIDARGLRYDWVATQLGLTPDRFAHILDGRRPVPDPPEAFYIRLAKLLGVDSSEIRPAEGAAA